MARKLDKEHLQTAEGVLEAIESFYPDENRCALLPIPTLVRALGFEDEPEIIFDALKHLLSVEAVEVYIDARKVSRADAQLQMPGPEVGPANLHQIGVKKKGTPQKPKKIRAMLGFVRPKQIPGTPICGAGGCLRFHDEERYEPSYAYPPICCEPDLKSYDVIAVNSSGGKDSQAMLDAVYRRCCELGIQDRIVVYHADLRRVEWPGSKEVAQIQAEHYSAPFRSAAKGGYDSLLERARKKGEWPSGAGAEAQYCTSEFKRNVVTGMYFADTKTLVSDLAKSRKVRVLNCIGVRAEESTRRGKMDPMRYGSTQHGTSGIRDVDVWYPIFYWTQGEVWDVIRRSAVPHHWAYDIGMPRLSCVFCPFGSRDALMLAGLYNPELLSQYVEAEKFMGSGPLEKCGETWGEMVDGCVPAGEVLAAHKRAVREAKKKGREAPRLEVTVGGTCEAGYEQAKICSPPTDPPRPAPASGNCPMGGAWVAADGFIPDEDTMREYNRKVRAAKKAGQEPPPKPPAIEGKKGKKGYKPGVVCVPTKYPKPARNRQWRFKNQLTIEEIQDAIEGGELPGEDVSIDSQL